ncbi:MAG: hypothetical protein IH991_11805, partial [Planctomycetes bacterium]|nr:hypothetical protein [Planctomycetota bacterium]
WMGGYWQYSVDETSAYYLGGQIVGTTVLVGAHFIPGGQFLAFAVDAYSAGRTGIKIINGTATAWDKVEFGFSLGGALGGAYKLARAGARWARLGTFSSQAGRGRILGTVGPDDVSHLPLPRNVDDLITKLSPDDVLPPGITNLDDFVAGTDRLTGEIFVNGRLWETLNDAQKARVVLEELSHQRRILMHGAVGRRVRAIIQDYVDLARFNEELLAAYDATGSVGRSLSYAWNYPGLSQRKVLRDFLWLHSVGAWGCCLERGDE